MKLLKEPLLHFLLIGSALFLLYGWRGNSTSLPGGQAGTPTVQIVVNRDALDQMNNLFAKTWQRPPTEEEQQGLIEDCIRNEIYYREAIAMGLDRDDEVLKRRLRQKMEFIYEDITSWAQPTDEDLQAFMQKHHEKYLNDPQIAFRQVFINADSGERALSRMPGRFWRNSLQGAIQIQQAIPRCWNRRFRFHPSGTSGSSSVTSSAGTSWRSNREGGREIRSGFGLHLVLLRERVSGRLPDLDEAREMLTRDWTAERQKELKDAAYAKSRERYSVTVERPKEVAESVTTAANKKATTP